MTCVPARACKYALAEATELWPNRGRASDGICASPQHTRQNPTSDHETGNAFDLTHSPEQGCDAHHLANLLAIAGDDRVKYIISRGRIWNSSRDKPGIWRRYDGSNAHTKHMHVSIHASARDSARPWWKPLIASQEDIDIMDSTTRAYFDQRFAAVDGRLDVLEQEVAILRGAVKGTNSTGGLSWLGARFAEVKADLKAIKDKVA